ncbi:putative surface protease GP63, partial [Trypanosoma theileri]
MRKIRNSYETTHSQIGKPLYITPLLLLLLLFLCCASVCVAQKYGGVQSTGVVRELPRKGQSGVQAYTVATQENGGWELIRIEAFTRDLEDTSKYCTKAGQEVIDFNGNKAKCKEAEVLNDERHREYIKNIIPAAIKLHRDRLRVQPHKGKIIVPKFEDEVFCGKFTVPKEHRT